MQNLRALKSKKTLILFWKEDVLPVLVDIMERNCYSFEDDCYWEPSLTEHSSFFAYQDGSFPIPKKELYDFILNRYYRAYKSWGTFFIIATAEDYSVFITNKPDSHFRYTLHEESGLWISQDDDYSENIK